MGTLAANLTENFLSVANAARRIDSRPVTIRRMAARGEVRSVLLHGRYKISEQDLMRLMDSIARGGSSNTAKIPA